jgi:hypothetical protein
MYDLELPRISGFPSIWIFGWANPLEFHAAWGQTKSPNFLIILTQRTKLGEVINNYHMFRWSWWYNVSSKQFEKKTGRKSLPTSSNPKNIFENLNPTLKQHQGTMQVHEVLDFCVFMEIMADWNPGMWGWYKNYGYLQKQVVDVQLDVDTFGKLVSLCFIWITWVHGTYICGSMGETNVSWKQHLLSSKFMCGKSMILWKK